MHYHQVWSLIKDWFQKEIDFSSLKRSSKLWSRSETTNSQCGEPHSTPIPRDPGVDVGVYMYVPRVCVGRMQYGSAPGIKDMCSWGIHSCSGEIHVGIQPYPNIWAHVQEPLLLSIYTYITPDSNTGVSLRWRWQLVLNQYTLANTLLAGHIGVRLARYTFSHIGNSGWPGCDIWNLPYCFSKCGMTMKVTQVEMRVKKVKNWFYDV